MKKLNNFTRNAKIVEGLLVIYNTDTEYYEEILKDLNFKLGSLGLSIERRELTNEVLNESSIIHEKVMKGLGQTISSLYYKNPDKISFYFTRETLMYFGVISSDAPQVIVSGGLNKIKLAIAEVIKSAVDNGNLNELKELSDFGNSFKGMEQLPKDRDYRNLELGDWILIIEGKFDFNKLPIFQGDRPVTLDSAVNQQTAQNNQQQTPVGIKVKK